MAWRILHLRARERVPVPTLKQSHSLSSTKASFTLLTLYNYTTALTLFVFGVTGHLHTISYSHKSHDTSSTPLGTVPAHPTLGHPSLFCNARASVDL